MQGPVQTIPLAFSRLKREGFIRQLDAAQRLNLSEGELIAAHVHQKAFFQIIKQWKYIKSSLQEMQFQSC